jgi:ribonuclease D
MKLEYINTNAELQKCVEHLKKQIVISLDLEFDNNHFHYGFKICLIQIASQERCFVIDPFYVEIKPLFEVFENPNIQKILHSPGEDLRLLQLLGCFCKNIFDTNNACQLLNQPQLSLDKIIYFTLGIVINKQAQNSDWTLRPLTKEQIIYASNDVVYLIDVKQKLEKEIQKKQMTAWLKEENEYFDHIIFPKELDPFDIKHLSKDEDKYLTAFDFHLLMEVLKFREQKAMDLDKPAHQVFSRDVAKKLAFSSQKGEDFLYTKGITYYLKNNYTEEEFIQIIADAHKFAEDNELSKTTFQYQISKNHIENTDDEKEVEKEVENEQEITQENIENKKIFRKRRNTKEIEEIMNTIFLPIQQKIMEKYGEQFSRKIFSNGIARDIAKQSTKFENIKFQYRKEIIKGFADELGIDLNKI